LHITDFFEKPENLNILGKDSPLLELEAKVINISEGKNLEIVNRCRKLGEIA